MFRAFTFILLLFVLLSKTTAEEEIYSYKFNLDTTLVGSIGAEGHIFPNHGNTFISILGTYKNEKKPPSVDFIDHDFNIIESIVFDSVNSFLFQVPLVFDFDNDSFDEVVFAIREPDRIWYLYYDPSNSPQIKTKIFEIPVKDNYQTIRSQMLPVQLDIDKFYELMVIARDPMARKFSISGTWALDIEQNKILWEDLNTENTFQSHPISLLKDSVSFIIIAGSGSYGKSQFIFSNGKYFFIDATGNKIIYDRTFNEINSAIIDTNSKDYSCDSVAFIRAIDSKNCIMWEKRVGGKTILTKIDTLVINDEVKILLTVYSKISLKEENNYIAIINPLTGEIENKTFLKDILEFVFHNNNKIFSFLKNGKTTVYDLNLKEIEAVELEQEYTPYGQIQKEDVNLILCRQDIGLHQKIVALGANLNIDGIISSVGVIHYLEKSKLISVYNSRNRKSKLYSIQSVPWYDKITSKTLRNLAISFLTILVVTMVLWISTLRVSWKRIINQKGELEVTHSALKETTTKLVQAEKLAVYGTIASSIAHEINSPLGAIINSAQRLKENKNINFENNINLIEKAGKRAKSIIEKLLLGVQSNKNDMKANFTDVLCDWTDLSIKQFENLGISLQTDIKENPELAISSTELNQILTNLLFNARDSIMENNTNEKSILIKSQIIETMYSIIIQDSGKGFSNSKLEKPFEAFVTSKEKGKGTGLGLWVIKNILDNIGGDIKIKNSNIGAEVEILIPLYSEKLNG
ncbi:MAG: HAMP domain-containing histidine kinase [Bacteroidetes bacterium]|nr:HAMP domain-containing histidine kinase [Bacteroidota bacterium]MBU1114090.1 HAMP domain-containing histidine kinase [Bacteroidota bacterium]MBU1798862.1 HAMP domain-containing histidine kinase [Bacteroidota bacterium]